MSDIIKGIITSRNTIVEETQYFSNNNINSISSYQEKTILTLDNGKQYSTMLKVDAQCGDKVILLENSKTQNVESVFDKNNYYLLKNERNKKASPVLYGLLSSAINFGFVSLAYPMLTNHNISTYTESMSIGVFLIVSIISSILVGLAGVIATNQGNKEYKEEEDKNINIQMELKDFFEPYSNKKDEYVVERQLLNI